MSDPETLAEDADRPPSPCIRVCSLDARNVCLGCRRTLREIVDWGRMTAAEQLEIVVELPRRR